jgi:Polyketide cyclase / dehydrase and lipid transport
MGTYEHSTGVAADPDELFAYLADVHNLPDYFAAMEEAEPAGEAEGDVPDDSIAVHTVADVDGTRREGEAWFTTDPDTRTLRWGSEGPSHYGGELQVDADGENATVTVRLHTEHGEGERIQEGLETTLAQIKQNVEGHAPPNPS